MSLGLYFASFISLSWECLKSFVPVQACTKAKTSMYGAICAAGLKAAAKAKKLENRAEHFAIISLVDCRRYLNPVLTDATVGTYSTHHYEIL
jgi:hypothetical protein